MAVLLRVVLWKPYHQNIAFEWVLPLLEYYSDLDAIMFILKLSAHKLEGLSHIEDKDDITLVRILIEYVIRHRLYVYSVY